MRRRALLAVAGVVFGGGPAAAEEEAVRAILAALAARREGHALFVEERELAELEYPLRMRGRLLWRAPDRLEKHTEEPFVEHLVISGDRLLYRRPDRNLAQEIDLQAVPELRPSLEALRAVLTGDAALLFALYHVAVERRGPAWRLMLEPRSTPFRLFVQRLVLVGENGSLHRLETFAHGARSRLSLMPWP